MEATAVLACSFPGCAMSVNPEKAHVPSLAAVRQAVRLSEGKDRPVNAGDLAKHVHCKDHTAMGRSLVKMYPYIETVAELERRANERKVAMDHFAKYALPEPKQSKPVNDSMKTALQGAGFQSRNGKTAKAVA